MSAHAPRNEGIKSFPSTKSNGCPHFGMNFQPYEWGLIPSCCIKFVLHKPITITNSLSKCNSSIQFYFCLEFLSYFSCPEMSLTVFSRQSHLFLFMSVSSYGCKPQQDKQRSGAKLTKLSLSLGIANEINIFKYPFKRINFSIESSLK